MSKFHNYTTVGCVTNGGKKSTEYIHYVFATSKLYIKKSISVFLLPSSNAAYSPYWAKYSMRTLTIQWIIAGFRWGFSAREGLKIIINNIIVIYSISARAKYNKKYEKLRIKLDRIILSIAS